MPCQQRAERRCPRSSSDVLEPDPAPPAGALELLSKGLCRTSDRGRSECVLSGAVHLPRPPRILAEHENLTNLININSDDAARRSILHDSRAGGGVGAPNPLRCGRS